jgi:hypothetical protein
LTNAVDQLVFGEIAERMGRLPLINGHPTLEANRFAVSFGSASRNGKIVEIDFITFKSLPDGAPALVEWLCSQGCTNLKYGLSQGFDQDREPEE